MSLENFKKFVQLCGKDESVRDKVKEIGISNEPELVEYAAAEHGLEFNEDDMRAFAKEHGISDDELSEEDLEKIAGGCVTMTVITVASKTLPPWQPAGIDEPK